MNLHSLLLAVVTLLAVLVVATWLSRWLGLGAVLALLAAGVALGPSGFEIAPDVERLRGFTELGVVLLMFAIGLEMEPRKLWAMRSLVFGLGVIQVVGTGVLLAGCLALRGVGAATSVLGGLGLALSSTAMGMQLLSERGETATPHGRASFAILLLQDLAIVPLLAVVPLLASGGAAGEASFTLRLERVVLVLAALVVLGRWLLPLALGREQRGGDRRGFAALVLLAVLGAALAAEWAGLSMALGAFLTGVLLAGSELQPRIEGIVDPLKQALLDLFFIAVGMSIDLHLLAERGLGIAVTVLAIVALKGVALYGLGRWFRLGHGGALRMAALLSQAGEFGFVLFGAAVVAGVFSAYAFNIVVLVIALSMALTPLLLKAVDAMARPDSEASSVVRP
jgi:glutathione-regulated potassium-efflux system ancillary protein KefC